MPLPLPGPRTIAFAALSAVVLVAACAATANRPAQAPTYSAADVSNVSRTAVGGFEGRSQHVTTGSAAIGRIGGQWVIVLEENFSFDGAPDPKVALGRNGFDANTLLAPLASNNGQQIYAIPDNLDVADFNEIWIWCEQFSVPLGVARLTLT